MNKSLKTLSLYIFPVLFVGLIVTLVMTHNHLVEVILNYSLLVWVLLVAAIGYKVVSSDMLKSSKYKALSKVVIVFLIFALVAFFVKWHFS
ncbi:hypothetical protein CF386_10025 [Paraphotobacterium marinum]|uniref:Uncharacterized protein n=1 Tax=Paraphotobacterium marinum TaxID=1755811 RepID=A0A220VG45_9GAMM|nr:hypothetical protein [Paraphotobacterium marinum]ASK79388.1 hypothetical protein CF386_10025 [Paraphotobacterium marinum]